MDLYYIRHGEPDYVIDTLTKRGHEQAEKTSHFLVSIPFDKIFASSHGRAIETSKHVTQKNHMDITPFDWAREQYGWERMSDINENGDRTWFFAIPKYAKVLKELIDDKNWYDNKIFFPTIKAAILYTNEQIDKWLLSVNVLHKDGNYKIIGDTPKNVAFFAHGGFGLMFLARILDINYPKVVLEIGEHSLCGVTHIRIDDSGAKLISFNKIYY